MEALEKLDNEEAHILNLLARGLSREFPNPQRVGCPDSGLLRGIAFRELRLADVQQWLDHLSACSPVLPGIYQAEAESQTGTQQIVLVVTAVLIFVMAGD